MRTVALCLNEAEGLLRFGRLRASWHIQIGIRHVFDS